MTTRYKTINARVFLINRINKEATEPDNNDILSIIKTALDKKSNAGLRKMTLNKQDNDEDLLASFDWGSSDSYLFGLMMRLVPENNSGKLSQELLQQAKISLQDISVNYSSKDSLCVDHYYFIINNNFLITNLNGRRNIDVFKTYINWLTTDTRGNELISFYPKTVLPKDLKISEIKRIEIGDQSQISVDLSSDSIGKKITTISKSVLEGLFGNNSIKSINDIDLADLVSAKLILSIKKKPSNIPENDFHKILGSIISPISNDDDIVMFGDKNKKLSGSDIKMIQSLDIEETSRGNINEEQLKQKFEELLYSLDK